MHRGCSTSGPSTTGMRWLDRALARGPSWPRLILVGDADEASDGGSPLLELFRSRREVEEQLRACQSFCVRGWRRELHGP